MYTTVPRGIAASYQQRTEALPLSDKDVLFVIARSGINSRALETVPPRQWFRISHMLDVMERSLKAGMDPWLIGRCPIFRDAHIRRGEEYYAA